MTRLPDTTWNEDTLQRNIYISATLHLIALLVLFFGLPSFVRPLPEPEQPIPIDIVDISEITQTKKAEPTPQPPAPPPKPVVQQVVVPPPQVQAPPPPPKPPEPAKPEQVEMPMPMPMPKPDVKPTPPPPPPKPKDDLRKILKDLEKKKADETPVKLPDLKDLMKDKQEPVAQAKPAPAASSSLSDRLTISQEDALRRQIESCWSPPIGARDAKNLVVDVTINVNPDRTVQTAEVVDKGRMASDSFYRAAAEAARRAVLNPRCSPLELPEGKYEQWKVIHFTFDPRDVL